MMVCSLHLLLSLRSLNDHGLQLCSGRVVITAARLAAATGVGIELDMKAAAKAQQAVVNGKQFSMAAAVAAAGKIPV